MTTTQVKGAMPTTTTADDIQEILNRREMVQEEGADAEALRLLALEIIMYDPDLAKQLVKAGVQRVLQESPSASG